MIMEGELSNLAIIHDMMLMLHVHVVNIICNKICLDVRDDSIIRRYRQYVSFLY